MQELKTIEAMLKHARAWLRRCFRGRCWREGAELDAEHLERVQGEDDRRARFMDGLRETMLEHLYTPQQ